ncbi:TIGR04283 family arsenosugar biosynthesis glycosyltransferase [Rhodopirellula sp. SWK7]|uniref:TIGR04283 family arsenosugar biosynthesis glycosyltransferase n=1 Tax=Rhodopirellula sp. SWK7 TaxID=595460 RepID=UPI0002BFF908|nr:TIGR04283 family arsenosugar biosynthesis glycosyltransferase [Rhodopirellula sp. SWK7]EMI45652.1 glycosyl transferase family protein [Rhodopirellula sp. SWK7]
MLDLEMALRPLTRRRFSQPERVIVLTRYPEPGLTKTRLIPAVGAEAASRIQDQLTKRALGVAMKYGGHSACDIEVRFAAGDRIRMENRFGLDKTYRRQGEGDLGARLVDAFGVAFAEGAERVLVIGSDCPDLKPSLLSQANDALAEADVVLGPAQDGGYYLIGLRSARPELFEDIEWGSEDVLQQTRQRAREVGLKIHELKTLRDIDTPEDLILLRRRAREFDNVFVRRRSGVVSVIVPTLNEAEHLGNAIKWLVGIDAVEVIVADGGSSDGTVEIARRLGAKVVVAAPSRARQMNAGAALASGDVLLFLHADTILPDDFVDHVRQVIRGGSIAGAFELTIDGSHAAYRLIEWMVRLRSRYLHMPYGDQAIFVSAEHFYRMEGYPNWPLMEDVDLCRRLRARGRIGRASASVQTSARRWSRLGIVKTTVINLCCLVGYRLGISPFKLKRWYDGGVDQPTS